MSRIRAAEKKSDVIEPVSDATMPRVGCEAAPSLSGVLSGNEAAWRTFVGYYDVRLRAVVRHAAEATDPLTEDEIDDVLGDFWLALIANDKRMLRAFDPKRGSELLTWLMFHVARIVYERLAARAQAPRLVSLRHARNVPDPRPSPMPAFRSEIGGANTIDAAIRECVRSTVVSVVRQELATANADRNNDEADRPRAAAWWAEHLGCSAESLVKRAKRGSLEYVKIGARYYFTRAQVEGSRRGQEANDAS